MSKASEFEKAEGGGWRVVIHDLRGYRFWRSVGNPEVWMRGVDLGNGRIRVRYAWDGDGIVRDSLSEVAEAIDADKRR